MTIDLGKAAYGQTTRKDQPLCQAPLVLLRKTPSPEGAGFSRRLRPAFPSGPKTKLSCYRFGLNKMVGLTVVSQLVVPARFVPLH
jgi:hypothetical protein